MSAAATDAPFAASDRIRDVAIDSEEPAPIEVDQERRVAIFDLIEENRFRLRDAVGPHRLTVAAHEGASGGFVFSIEPEGTGAARRVTVAEPALMEASEEYLALCAAYRDAVRRLPPSRIEQADAERRALHTEASELLRAGLAPEIDTDGPTARRLFTLCCALTAGRERLR